MPSPRTVVTSRDGVQGTLDPPSQPLDGSAPQVTIRLDNGQHVVVPVELLRLLQDGEYFLPLKLGQLEIQPESDISDQGSRIVILPVIEEELVIQKQQVKTGGLRVTKKVHSREQIVDEPGFAEEIEFERVPVNQELENPASVRYEGDTLIIPLMEEVLVVEKRLFLKEEIRITKRRKEIRQPQQVMLRSEEAVVEPLSGGLTQESSSQLNKSIGRKD